MSAGAGGWQQGAACGVRPDRASEGAPEPQPGRWAARLRALFGPVLLRLWAGVEARRATQRRRSLRVVETVAMGEKRFVAILQVQDARYLIGGGAAGVSLLARLDREQEFAAVLEEQGSPSASSRSSLAAKKMGEAW